MKVFCPECIEEMKKIKLKVGDTITIRHYECKDCGIDIRTEE